MSGAPQPYHTTMSWQQLIAAVQADMTALYAGVAGSVTSVGLTPGSSDITVGAPNPVTSTGSIPIDLSATVKTELGLAGSALQPVTGLAGSYTYATLTLNASGQITAVGSGAAPPAGANPTGTVGLAAVNGVATTYLRSDGAPALSQAIAPTMTGAWTFTPGGSSIAITVNAASGNFAQNLIGNATANNSYGQVISAGTSASDIALLVRNQAQTSNFLEILGNGVASLKGPLTITGALGINGAAAPAQVTGWGTPTGASVVANFNGGAGTLVNCSNAIAELITILKAAGLIGA
jgi:hypothetical protein